MTNILIIIALIEGAFLILVLSRGVTVHISDKPAPEAIILPRKPVKETDEQRRERVLLENIEAYDGTSKGQVKI
jgi:hypothetical protein